MQNDGLTALHVACKRAARLGKRGGAVGVEGSSAQGGKAKAKGEFTDLDRLLALAREAEKEELDARDLPLIDIPTVSAPFFAFTLLCLHSI